MDGWIICLFWFDVIKLNFEDKNNKGKTLMINHFWLLKASGSWFLIYYLQVLDTE